MHKRMIMSCLAIGAFMALVVAPAASASPVLTENGEPVAVGSSILAKNTGNVVFSGGFEASCSNAELAGTVTANTGTSIKAEIPVGGAKFSGTGASGDCTSALGDFSVTVNSKICEETVKGTDTDTITGCGAPLTYTLTVTSGLACKYSAASVSATFLTGKDATLNVEKQTVKKEEGSILCPSEGSLSVDFDQTTTNGETLLIS
ncbi:MAG TPA: hypothetical protein VFP21_00900 [Solirubrobacterales bacterium]|nr:hypothetical protein [Solirubrobacterales bacterium]